MSGIVIFLPERSHFAVSIGNKIFLNLIMLFQLYWRFIFPDINYKDGPFEFVISISKVNIWDYDLSRKFISRPLIMRACHIRASHFECQFVWGLKIFWDLWFTLIIIWLDIYDRVAAAAGQTGGAHWTSQRPGSPWNWHYLSRARVQVRGWVWMLSR